MKYRNIQTILIICLSIFICAVGVADAPVEKALPDIEDVFFEFFGEYIALKPEKGTELALPADLGIPLDHSKLDNVSDAADDRLYALFEQYRDLLENFDEDQLTKAELVTRATLLWYLKDGLEGKTFRYHTYIMNPMFSFHNQLTTLLTEHHVISQVSDAEDYIKRLEQYPARVEQLIEQIDIRKKKRLLAPRFVIEKFVAELDSFTAVPVEENILIRAFERKLDVIGNLDEKTQQELIQRALHAVDTAVYPAYKKMIQYIEEVKFFADEKAGVWKLQDGKEYYEYCLQHHTTTDLTPQEVHEIGLAEGARIQGEITTLYKQLGISSNKSYADMTAEYWSKFYKEPYIYTADEQGVQQTLQDYQKIIDEMYDLLPDLFKSTPARKVHVERVPVYKERTAGTYYQPASFDPTSEGIFYANLAYQHFKPGMKTLTFHEAIPGHHLQFALETESPEYHPVKSLFFFTGYAEGWALYSEKLAREYDMYTDAHEKLGNLRSELFRAVRLVVDTGIHWKKWTRQQAYEYMKDNTGWASYGEIDRYITWPGQACAYKVGELSILALRDIAREHLGDAFDIKDFHTAVLEHGSVPLDILEELVEEYIDTRN